MFHHTSVLHTAVLTLLAPKRGETVLDVTLGLGGHAKSFLDAIGPSGYLFGLDADQENLVEAGRILAKGASQMDLRHGNFRDLPSFGFSSVDILFADLGLSSPHIDDPARGFSFRSDSALDLRFDRTTGMAAARLIAISTEHELAEVLRQYGEVPSAHLLAQAMKESEIATTVQLKKCVERVRGYRAPAELPRVFQALRIAVNDELGALQILLQEGPKLLNPGGRMGVISYHSLEDRLVKDAFRALATPQKDPTTGAIRTQAPFTLITKKPVRPEASEIAANVRARSAKFRVLQHRLH
ncbi:MAG: 16S rRNA (cytosine(1402)-N(4))-methyltransferase RsmH [Candidatus Peribacteraceae bacterium]|nr:16S rRNA (cytosine(1402)-N(4))-methyltransferase RsmH [Candidatus Peribacteraceae bacterium]